MKILSKKYIESTKGTVSKGTISKLIAKAQIHGTIVDLPKTGRPTIFTEEEKQALIDTVLDDRKTTAIDLWKDPNLNPQRASIRTVRNVLAEEGLFASARLPVYIPPDSIQKCLLFAEKYGKKPEIWTRVVFSDESDILANSLCGVLKERKMSLDTTFILSGIREQSKFGDV